jgi:imidazolonepropionase
MSWDILIKNIKGLVQVRAAAIDRVAGAEMATLPVIADAFLAIKDGLIADYGAMSELPADASLEIIDATGCFVFPSFVDSHTHLVFASSREEEFVLKINGATYAEIAAKGGGILNSARKLRQTSEDELFDQALHRANEMIRTGTGAVEIKSGYGLTTADEIKMLRVARRIGMETPLTVKTTFLGAHAIPEDRTKSDYIKAIKHEMIPAIADEGLADYIDVFCEEGFFSPSETASIVEEGKRYGMKPKIHANQLHRSGGVQVGIETGAVSVDHLESIGPEEIQALVNSRVMPTALPGAAFFLRLPYPPAREMIAAGLPVAIASDYNPGSAPSGNMPLMLSLACIQMRMTPAEAINAATINSACAMEIQHTHATITRGKIANVFITTQIPSIAYLPYAFGSYLVDTVILRGKVVPG